jgi:hypothetical protein
VKAKVAQKWKDLIEGEVKIEKRRRLQNDTMSLGRLYYGENNDMGSRLEWFESVQRRVYYCENEKMKAEFK